VTPTQHHDKVFTFPSSPAKSRPSTAPPVCPFPTTGKRNQTFTTATERRRRETEEAAEEEEEEEDSDEEEEDCGCGSPPAGFEEDSEDDLDVLNFVLKDQQLALRGPKSSPFAPRVAGETGLGLFKRQGVEGLSLTPATGEPPVLAKPTITLRRPSTAPATVTTDSTTNKASGSRTPRTRNRTISNLIPKLRLPKPGSSESDDSTDEEARESDETVSTAARRRRSNKKKREKKAFDRFIMPSEEELLEARKCELVGETGVTVTLDELIKQRGRVVFVALVSFTLL
jgi:hypothetical protein